MIITPSDYDVIKIKKCKNQSSFGFFDKERTFSLGSYETHLSALPLKALRTKLLGLTLTPQLLDGDGKH